MQFLFLFLTSAIGGIFAKYLFARILMLTSFISIAAAFLTYITNQLLEFTSPTLPDFLVHAISSLPPNTATYLTICISALIARWTFQAGARALRIMTSGS